MAAIKRFFQAPAQSFFLFGPRGTGKSLWARETWPGSLYLDLLDPETFRLHAGRPERLRERVLAEPATEVVVLDEVQRVPALLDVVHGLIEERPGLRFVLTGSSARKLKRSGVNLLAGRALVSSLHPFMAAELGSAFDLEDALQHGLLPLAWAAPDRKGTLQAYHALYLREEVQHEGLVRNLGDFSRFLEAISFSHGAPINLNEVARECQVSARTVGAYLEILEDLLLGARLPVFSHKARRRTAAHPKFFLFDAGVFQTLRPGGPLDRPTEREGPALEGLVWQHLRAWNAYRQERNKLFSWRTRSGVEVDLILYGEDGFWAVEVKNAAKVRSQDLRPLRLFRQDYPECRALLLYRGREPLLMDEILCLPCEAFLRALDPRSAEIDAAFR